MDVRTGQTYESKEAALAAGVPEADIIHLRRITKGPFKGRIYEDTGKGLGRRRLDLEAAERRQKEARRLELREPQVRRRPPATFEEMTAEDIRDEVARNPREEEV